MKNSMELRKQLECLYAWSDFYLQNKQDASFNKCQQQITDFKLKYVFV